MIAERKEERVRRRHHLASRVEVPTGLSFLETVTIAKATRTEYTRKVENFVCWARGMGVDWADVAGLDEILVQYLDQKFFEGGTPDEGAKLIAGLAFYDVKLYRNVASMLPRAHRAMKGWMKVGPSEQRLPFPLVLLYPVTSVLIHKGLIDMAICLMIQHNAYLRPGEVTSLQVMQLVPPLAGARAPYHQWAVNIAPFELLRPAKTGMMDESVTLDFMEWAEPVFKVLVENRAPHAPLFNFTLAELSKEFLAAVDLCNMRHLRPCLYGLRHGGASEDYLRHRRNLEDIQRRGRWRTQASVRRYTKEAKLLVELHKVDNRIIQYGHYLEERCQQLFLHPGSVMSVNQWLSMP